MRIFLIAISIMLSLGVFAALGFSFGWPELVGLAALLGSILWKASSLVQDRQKDGRPGPPAAVK